MNTVTTPERSQTATATIKRLYTAKMHTTGGRDGGSSQASDGRLAVKLSLPGTPGTGTNPEQLFAAGWSACFIGAMKNAGPKMNIKVPNEVAIDAEADLNYSDDGYSIAVRFNISLPGLDRDAAESLIEAAHQTCPYSKATRGNINFSYNIL